MKRVLLLSVGSLLLSVPVLHMMSDGAPPPPWPPNKPTLMADGAPPPPWPEPKPKPGSGIFFQA